MTKQLKIDRLRVDEPKEIPLVLGAIRAALDRGDLFLKYYTLSQGALEWRLTDPQKIVVSASEPMGVVPLVNLAEWRYWLGMQLKFVLAMGEVRFQIASLTVFRSALVGEEKKRLLRAEWERIDDPERRNNAQPHWHVYLAELDHGQVDAARPVVQRFHFAMTSGWHLGESESNYREPSPTGVAGWIQHCVSYTRGQLVTLSKKSR
jgi:hypothetical protein